MTAESLLSHLTEFGGTDLKHCPALAVKLFNELNNKVEFIDEHGQVTCEEKKLTYLKKMWSTTKFAVVHCIMMVCNTPAPHHNLHLSFYRYMGGIFYHWRILYRKSECISTKMGKLSLM